MFQPGWSYLRVRLKQISGEKQSVTLSRVIYRTDYVTLYYDTHHQFYLSVYLCVYSACLCVCFLSVQLSLFQPK